MSPKELENSETKILKGKKLHSTKQIKKPINGKISVPDIENENRYTPLEQLKREDINNKDFPDSDVALEEENVS